MRLVALEPNDQRLDCKARRHNPGERMRAVDSVQHRPCRIIVHRHRNMPAKCVSIPLREKSARLTGAPICMGGRSKEQKAQTPKLQRGMHTESPEEEKACLLEGFDLGEACSTPQAGRTSRLRVAGCVRFAIMTLRWEANQSSTVTCLIDTLSMPGMMQTLGCLAHSSPLVYSSIHQRGG